MSEGKIEKETIIEYSTNEGESFIALVLYNDEKEVVVPQQLWFAFLDTAFNGEIRDMFPFLDKHFAWPEDLKKCSGRVWKWSAKLHRFLENSTFKFFVSTVGNQKVSDQKVTHFLKILKILENMEKIYLNDNTKYYKI